MTKTIISRPFPNLINIIPDTSWLLNASSVAPELISTTLYSNETPPAGFLGWLFESLKPDRVSQPYVIPHTWILLSEVLDEITSIHENQSEKRERTGHAKLLLKYILENASVERDSGSLFPPVTLVEGKIGLDSQTDLGILSAAAIKSQIHQNGISVILTDDSGLHLEVSSQRRHSKLRVYTSADSVDFRRIAAEQLFSTENSLSHLYSDDLHCSWKPNFNRKIQAQQDAAANP